VIYCNKPVGSPPDWMSQDQWESNPCPCILDPFHPGPCMCRHTAPKDMFRYVCIKITNLELVIRIGHKYWAYPLPEDAQRFPGMDVCPVRKPRLP
jgi:hypothetical protein